MIEHIDLKNLNVLALAYMGDAIYEVYIRNYLISQKIAKVKDLQKNSVNYVSAKAQSKFLKEMINKDFLTNEEIIIVKRARNHKSRVPKNTDIITYKLATGLEALIGYHYLNKNDKRVKEIMKEIIGD